MKFLEWVPSAFPFSPVHHNSNPSCKVWMPPKLGGFFILGGRESTCQQTSTGETGGELGDGYSKFTAHGKNSLTMTLQALSDLTCDVSWGSCGTACHWERLFLKLDEY